MSIKQAVVQTYPVICVDWDENGLKVLLSMRRLGRSVGRDRIRRDIPRHLVLQVAGWFLTQPTDFMVGVATAAVTPTRATAFINGEQTSFQMTPFH